VPFDQTVAHQEAADFVTSVLVDTLAVTHLSVGDNFRFGHHALGDAALLAADTRFQTTVVPLVSIDGVTVSSTLIRSLIEGGDVAQATRLLGAPFKMASAVVPGDQRGRELGFPTANLIPDPRYVCPAHGVYAARVGEQLAAVNVGVRPTFGDGLTPLVEAHLLDFSGDLYGKTLTIEFIDRLRSEVRFETAEQLIAQMRADVERTREVLASGVA
jgi:riboflavin kinase/FMN adenylyltransferase